MLAELLDIQRGLERAGFITEELHKDIAPLGKRAVLCATVGSAGVKGVRLIGSDSAPRYWTLGNGNHNRFPLIGVGDKKDKKKDRPADRPLRSKADQRLIKLALDGNKASIERLDALHQLIRQTRFDPDRLLPWPDYRGRLAVRAKSLEGLRGTRGESCLTLLQRVLDDADGSRLLRTLDAALIEFASGSVELEAIEPLVWLLFTGGGEVLLDTETVSGSRSAVHPDNVQDITRVLSSLDRGDASECQLTGRPGVLEDGDHPKVTLPVVGRVPLYAKNKHTPSSFRYGRAKGNGFRASRAVARQLRSAAQAITRPGQKGKTWAKIPSERGGYDLLISYAPALGLERALAKCCSCEVDDDVPDIRTVFKELAEACIAAAKGKERLFEHADFIVVRKVNPGNAKVIHRTTKGIGEVGEAAARWTRACGNIPPNVRLSVPVGRDVPAETREPGFVVPAAIVKLGREVFVEGGTRPQDSPGPTFADAMRLFFSRRPDEVQPVAARLLHLFLARRVPVLAGFAHARARGPLKGFDARAALDTVTLFGLLLGFLGWEKEAYMEDAAFKLGQLLAGADVLHRGYCEHQRGGSVPSSLLGNQLLGLAQRSPRQALVAACSRWRVYFAWADRYRDEIKRPQDGSEDNRAWAIWNGVIAKPRMQSLAEPIGRMLLESSPDDRFKAEMFLGYIAGLPRSGKIMPPSTESQRGHHA